MNIADWTTIALGVLALGYIGYLIYKKEWLKLKAIAYGLMLQAERVFSEDEGKEKMDAVLESIYNTFIPTYLQKFITREVMREKLQDWYDIAKEFLNS